MQIKNLETALHAYYLDNGFYPSTEQGLQALAKEPRMAPIPNNYNPNGYIDVLPLDPWQGEYQYRLTGEKKNPFVITCYGRDGKPGGKGQDADITSLDLHE